MKKLLLLSLILLSSCRIVKKEWVTENFTEKSSTLAVQKQLKQEIERRYDQLNKTITFDFDRILKDNQKKATESINELTTIRGTIEAEEGKEKRVSAGDFKIVANGANVSFETTRDIKLYKSLESEIKTLKEHLNIRIESVQKIEKEQRLLNLKVDRLENELSSIKKTSSKKVDRRSFSIGFYLFILFLIGLFFAYIYLRKRVSWFV